MAKIPLCGVSLLSCRDVPSRSRIWVLTPWLRDNILNLLKAKRVLIVGLGLIGGSVARGLRKRGLRRAIYACGRDDRPLREAAADGVVDEWATDLPTLAAKAALILIAVPTLTVRRVLEQ